MKPLYLYLYDVEVVEIRQLYLDIYPLLSEMESLESPKKKLSEDRGREIVKASKGPKLLPSIFRPFPWHNNTAFRCSSIAVMKECMPSQSSSRKVPSKSPEGQSAQEKEKWL